MNQNTVDEGKTLALVAYLTLIGTLIAFFMNQDKRNPFIFFHIRQGLGLWVLFISMGYVVSYFNNWSITFSWWIFFSVLFIYGILGAISGKMNTIPLLGNVFQKLFKSLGNK